MKSTERWLLEEKLSKSLESSPFLAMGRRTLLPPRKHRLLVMVLLAAGAYCLLLHQQQQVQTLNVVLAPQGNASRALNAFKDDDSASQTVAGGVVWPAPEEELEEELEEVMARRRERVWEVCRANGLVDGQGRGVRPPNAWEFMVDKDHHLVWCNVFKAASSSWMYNFNLLGGYTADFLKKTKKGPLTLARTRFPRPSIQDLKGALPNSLSFLIVRDPFERLLSAYRNKLEGFRHKFYRKMARDMILLSRGTNPQAMPRGAVVERGPTFSEFVTWLIFSVKKASGKKEGGANGIPGFDEHWAPYYRFCTPCSVNFTVIAKMETLSRDEKYIIRKTGTEDILDTKEDKEVKPQTIINAAVGGKTEDVLPKYFRTLSLEQLEALYDIYQTDFDMFGYDASKYFQMVMT